MPCSTAPNIRHLDPSLIEQLRQEKVQAVYRSRTADGGRTVGTDWAALGRQRVNQRMSMRIGLGLELL